MPWVTLAPVAAAFASPDEAAGLTDDPRAAAAVRAGLREVDVDLRAEVGETHLALDDVLALRPGDVVRLDAMAGDDTAVYADGVPVHRARAGRSGAPPRDPDPRALRGGDAMNADAPLLRLGESTAEAVERALQNASPGAARVGAVVAGHGAEQAGEQAVHGLAVPAVCAEVSYVDGVTGGNVFLLPVEGARRLAAAMMGEEAPAPRPRAPSSPSSSSAPWARP